jgi:hypothetical protein
MPEICGDRETGLLKITHRYMHCREEKSIIDRPDFASFPNRLDLWAVCAGRGAEVDKEAAVGAVTQRMQWTQERASCRDMLESSEETYWAEPMSLV